MSTTPLDPVTESDLKNRIVFLESRLKAAENKLVLQRDVSASLRNLVEVNKRKQKRLEAAEHICRAFRQGISYYAEQQHYFNVALDWLGVWIDNAPKRTQQIPVQSPPRRRRPQ